MSRQCLAQRGRSSEARDDIGQVQGEFIYYNPPNVYNKSDGKTFTRWPKRNGYALGFIANGKLRIQGSRDSMSIVETAPGCLVIIYETVTYDGYDFSARFERCDPERFGSIASRAQR